MHNTPSLGFALKVYADGLARMRARARPVPRCGQLALQLSPAGFGQVARDNLGLLLDNRGGVNEARRSFRSCAEARAARSNIHEHLKI